MRAIQRFYCNGCESDRRFSRRSANHRFHWRLTLFSFGLWSPAWLAIAIQARKNSWRCTLCFTRLPRAPLKVAVNASADLGAFDDLRSAFQNDSDS
jgi:hypothetical protein